MLPPILLNSKASLSFSASLSILFGVSAETHMCVTSINVTPIVTSSKKGGIEYGVSDSNSIYCVECQITTCAWYLS